MNFISTRGVAPATDIGSALLAGLAPDGGLYVPEQLPRMQASDFDGCTRLPDVATRLLQPFFAESELESQLATICDEALDFPVPLTALANAPNTQVLELFHGPTAAFKDVGARFLAACLARLHRGERELTILVATSGDTGAAVASAFHRRPGLRVVILYPDGRVSPRQAHQLGCFGDNVDAFKVAGSFDDCQRMVKLALADRELQAQRPLSSANSISLGRLLPQMSYYAMAALARWRATENELGFVIPTGNLGNAMAALMARAIGLPIGAITLATNANHVLADYFAGGEYLPHDSIATLANAMDVGAPSNFERLGWLFPDDPALRNSIAAEVVDDDTIRATIRNADRDHAVALCPHSACALAVLRRLRAAGDRSDQAIVATAHAAKFEQVVEPLLGCSVAVPASLAELLDRSAKATPMAADYAAFRKILQTGGFPD
ncbi:MAG: threonine synthase [Dokdonella sp.]